MTTTIKKIEANYMYSVNQLEQAKSMVNMLLRVPIQDRDFLLGIRTLQRILDMAQNRPPQGKADGSINEDKWNKLSVFLKACRTINAEGCQLYQLLEGIKGPLAITAPEGWSDESVGTCPVCNEPQFETPSGPCCKNGHGGA